MSIFISSKPEVDVVNVGDEISSAQLAAITATRPAGQAPSGTNPFLTSNQVNIADYVTSAFASATYQTISGMSAYQTVSGMSAYQTVAGMSAYATQGQLLGLATLSGPNVFTISSGNATPIIITNSGTGNSFVVNDSSPDSSPFVINSAGLVGIGIAAPQAALDVGGNTRIDTSGSDRALLVMSKSTTATVACVEIENRTLGNSLFIHDTAAPDASAFVVNNQGDVVIGATTVTAGSKLDVIGETRTTSLRFSGSSASVTNIQNTGATGVTAVAGTALTAGNYPQELTISVNGVNFRVPARII